MGLKKLQHISMDLIKMLWLYLVLIISLVLITPYIEHYIDGEKTILLIMLNPLLLAINFIYNKHQYSDLYHIQEDKHTINVINFLLIIGIFVSTSMLLIAIFQSRFWVDMLTLINEGVNINRPKNTSLDIYALISVVILAPLFEEMIFRRVLTHVLTRKYGKWVGVILPSIVFAMLHAEVYVFLISVMLSILYVKTYEIKYNIIVHITLNAATALLKEVLSLSQEVKYALLDNQGFTIESKIILVTTVLGLSLTYFLLRSKKVDYNKV